MNTKVIGLGVVNNTKAYIFYIFFNTLIDIT